MTRKDAIQQALATVYTRSNVEPCAINLDQKWNTFTDPDEGLQYCVQMIIWNWFAGGGTAEIAAGRVIKAVDSMDQE